MYLSTRVLGSNIVEQLAKRVGAPVLVIGSDRFLRKHLATVDCFNFIAAMRLSAACEALHVKSTRDLFERVPPSALVLPGVGAVALAVLGAAFEAKGIGGDVPLEAWAAKHRAEGARDFVTFATMKIAEAKREEGEKRARKQRAARRHGRRDAAQRLRVGRFTERRSRESHAIAH